jgi:hypothetical protein
MPKQRALRDLLKRNSNQYIVVKTHGHEHADKYIGRVAVRGAYPYLDGIIQNVYEYNDGVVTRSRVMNIPLTHYSYSSGTTWNDLTEEDESIQRAVDDLVDQDTRSRVKQVQAYNRKFPGEGFPGLSSRVKGNLNMETTSRASRRSPGKLPGRFAELPVELTAMVNKYRTMKDEANMETTSRASRRSPGKLGKLPGRFAELPDELSAMVDKYRTGGTRRRRK